jgi:hypothetical protein
VAVADLARKWTEYLTLARRTAWGIPQEQYNELAALLDAAQALLIKASDEAERTHVITVECQAAFKALEAKLRFFKDRFYRIPPMSIGDWAALGLRIKDTTPTPTPPPLSQAEADITRPGVHLLELHLRQISGSPPDPDRADDGFRTYWGVLPPGGATVDAAVGAKRELLKAPLSGEDLPHSRFTRRKKERFDFPAEDSGKTAYFCVRYENAKGEPGPWGPLFSSVIP